MKFFLGFVLLITIAIVFQVNNVEAASTAEIACAGQAEAPVCGFNGKCFKTFKNQCTLLMESCRGKKTFTQVAACKCDEASILASKKVCLCKNSFQPTPE